MNVVIDIPEEVYKCVMDGTYCGSLYEELKNGVPVDTNRDCMTVEEYRAKLIDAFHKADHDELIALVTLPTEKDFEHLEWLLKTYYGNREKCGDCVSRRAIIGKCEDTAKATSESGEINTGFIMALDFIADYAKHMSPVEPEKTHELCEGVISRREAIKKFTYDYKGERIPEYDCDNFPTQISFKDVKKWIRELPSVEPEKCGDCISRQALQEWIKDKTFGDIVVASEHNFDCLPPVEPERKPGKWINIDGTTNSGDCSCCGNRGRVWMNYCYECGARMVISNDPN